MLTGATTNSEVAASALEMTFNKTNSLFLRYKLAAVFIMKLGIKIKPPHECMLNTIVSLREALSHFFVYAGG